MLRNSEFVPLVALLMSLSALSTDAMLPALPDIGSELGAAARNDVQYIITALFLGMGIGPLLFGPLSDCIGRKSSILIGLVLFMAGCVISIAATQFWVMIAGAYSRAWEPPHRVSSPWPWCATSTRDA